MAGEGVCILTEMADEGVKCSFGWVPMIIDHCLTSYIALGLSKGIVSEGVSNGFHDCGT